MRLAPLLARWLPGTEILRHPAGLPGKPDFWIPSLSLAVFVDGCFFHGCPQHYRPADQNGEYWQAKIARNKKRDAEVNAELKCLGCSILRIWEHELKGKKPVGRHRIRRRIRRVQQVAAHKESRRAAEARASYGEESSSNFGASPIE
jgi:DNA mismatch endonuclease Vsr